MNCGSHVGGDLIVKTARRVSFSLDELPSIAEIPQYVSRKVRRKYIIHSGFNKDDPVLKVLDEAAGECSTNMSDCNDVFPKHSKGFGEQPECKDGPAPKPLGLGSFEDCESLLDVPDSAERSPHVGGRVKSTLSCTACARCSRYVQPITQSDLDLAISSEPIKEWVPGQFQMLKQLQVANRNFGRVFMMQNSIDQGHARAVKAMPSKWVTSGPQAFSIKYPKSKELPWQDIAMIKKLSSQKCPYTCDFLGVFRDDKKTYVAMSLAMHGDLLAWCDQAPPPGHMREMMMLPIAGQVMSAVRWLHDVGVAHRDLSLDNILLDGTDAQQVKLIDFGMISLQRQCKREKRGKRPYQSPEMHIEHEYYDAYLADTFALGVVIFYMACGDYPWMSTKRGTSRCFDLADTYGFQKLLEWRLLRNGGRKHLAEVFSPSMVELLQGLLEIDPSARFVLGESCWDEDGGAPRHSVWKTRWLQKEAAVVGRCEACKAISGNSCNIM
jgi:hypothetical protein